MKYDPCAVGGPLADVISTYDLLIFRTGRAITQTTTHMHGYVIMRRLLYGAGWGELGSRAQSSKVAYRSYPAVHTAQCSIFEIINPPLSRSAITAGGGESSEPPQRTRHTPSRGSTLTLYAALLSRVCCDILCTSLSFPFPHHSFLLLLEGVALRDDLLLPSL